MDTVLNPLFYAAFAVVIWQCYRLRALHRRYWGVGLFSPGRLSVRQLVTSVAAGIIISVIFVASTWNVDLSVVYGWWLWAAMILLGCVRVRFMGFSYAAGTISMLALASQWLDVTLNPMSRPWLASLQTVDVGNLLLLAGVLTTVSGLLTLWGGDQSHCPVVLRRRGKPIGAVVLQAFWAVPVLLPTGDGWFILPTLLVYSDLAVARYAKQRARLTGLWTVGFGISLAVLSFIGSSSMELLWIGAIWALFGQEVITRLSSRQEYNGVPKFRTSDHGVRVLGVKASSPAQEMGILPGETITHANGQPVRNMTDLYIALQRSPAFCKLEVVNEDGEQRFAQRSLYADEPHQLGIIPVGESSPVEDRLPHRFGWWSLFFGRTDYRGNAKENRLDG